mgnify:CR=1 FL=1|tara:strand:+ start:816 stop:1187 length:372 start_codon:yes stop_codon:yes gene_type:complete
MKKRIILNLPTFEDERGFLTVLEDFLPFPIARTYWIYGVDGPKRGGHRHKTTRQALISLFGEVKLHINNGEEEISLILNKPSTCIIIEPEDWHTMTFSKNSILIVFASHKYNKDDYIYTPYRN